MHCTSDLSDRIKALKEKIAAEAEKDSSKLKLERMLELSLKLDKLFEEYITLKLRDT